MGHHILFFPWRDWNSMLYEGFRTREANILLSMIKNPKIEKILVVNRATQPKFIKKILLRNNHWEQEQKYSDLNFIKPHSLEKNGIFSSIKKYSEKLYVFDIKYFFPNPKGNKLERFSIINKLLYREILKSIKKVELSNYITWCCDLTRIGIAKEFKKNILVFDSIDNLLEHDQNKKDVVFLKNNYRLVNEKSDIIFTVSKELKNVLFSNHSNTTFIPNAIDLEKYDNIGERPRDLPIGKPIAGYIGLMQERLDIDLLQFAINNNPEVNFVFIGPILSPKHFEPIKKYSNVYFLGAKNHSLIPTYIFYFDLCLIPHKVNNFTKSMNPLKLYEYLVLGKEVLSTSVPPSDDFKHVIHISNDRKIFAEKIQEIINNPYSRFNRNEIIKSVSNETWNNRLSNMINIIEKKLEED